MLHVDVQDEWEGGAVGFDASRVAEAYEGEQSLLPLHTTKISFRFRLHQVESQLTLSLDPAERRILSARETVSG